MIDETTERVLADWKAVGGDTYTQHVHDEKREFWFVNGGFTLVVPWTPKDGPVVTASQRNLLRERILYLQDVDRGVSTRQVTSKDAVRVRGPGRNDRGGKLPDGGRTGNRKPGDDQRKTLPQDPKQRGSAQGT